nr:PREDICTED: aquaporin-9 isoform X2 [Latimeria chalumnae]|eukprot:XP_014345555.1 PREDICTED: aquaporin-9 isoform X2 [Latimeria chalumnae]
MDARDKKSFKDKFVLRNRLVKESLSEFLGTCLLIVFGCGSIAQSVLSHESMGGFLTINIAFPMAVTMAIYVGGGVSGAHINPAVSFAMCIVGRLNWLKLPFYIVAQMLGAFVGAGAVFGIYYALMTYTGGVLTVTGPNATAQIFATYPSPFLSIASGLIDQIIGTSLLLVCIFGIFDNKNNGVPKGLEPIAVGLCIMVLGLSMTLNCGCAINPARDLGPRMFTAVAGWGTEVFSAGNNWWWVPVVGPMIGAAVGCFIYVMFIELHHLDPLDESTGDNDSNEKCEIIAMK